MCHYSLTAFYQGPDYLHKAPAAFPFSLPHHMFAFSLFNSSPSVLFTTFMHFKL